MKINKVKLVLVLFGVLSLSILQAQETNSSSGGNAKGNEGSISYSVGQIVYSFHKEAACSLTQGVQQAYEISVVTGIEKAEIKLEMSVYPNPIVDHFNLQITDKNLIDTASLQYQLIDINGKQIENKTIWNSISRISCVKLKASIYFLTITQNKSRIKTFKIIKL